MNYFSLVHKVKKSSIFICLLLIVLFNLSCKDKAPTDAPEIITKISGIVQDKESGEAIAGVQITTTPVTSTITTDANGKYEFDKINPGSYVIKGSKNGYKDSQVNVQADEGASAKADIQLEKLTALMEVSNTFLDFGMTDTQISIGINNKSGFGSINFDIQNNASWLTLSDNNGTVTNTTKYIVFNVDRSKVNFGSYSTVVTINSNVGKIDVNVLMVKQNPNAPQMTISPINIDFGSTSNASNVVISNTGTGTLNWSSSTTANWVKIEPSSGTVESGSKTAIVTINRTGLTPGNYSGNIVFTSNGGNFTLPISVTVPTTPVLCIDSVNLDFSGDIKSKTIKISNSGSGALNWNITSNQSWLTVNTVKGVDNTLVIVSVNRNGLAQGDFNGKLIINSNGGNSEVNVIMKVLPPPPPNPVTLSNPYDINANSIRLMWTESDASGFISYKIYKDTQPNVTQNSTLVGAVSNQTTDYYQVTGLASDTKYYFRIYVISAGGVSEGSNVVSTTTTRKIGSWACQTTLPNVNVSNGCLYALDDNNVWVAGNNVIWHYNGILWNKETLPAGNFYLRSVYFASATEGWAVGSNRVVLKFNGTSWVQITDPIFSSYYDLEYVVLTSNNDVWITGYNNSFGGYGVMYHFNGSNWSKYEYPSYIYDIKLISSNEIYCCSGSSLYLYNGVGWSVLAKNDTLGICTGISVINSSDIWTISSSSMGKYDGTNMKIINDHSGLYNLSIAMSADNDGWLGIDKGIYHYDGQAWNKISLTTSSSIECIKMLNSKSGWAVGSGGEILRYLE